MRLAWVGLVASAVVGLSVLVGVGCFSTPKPTCAFLCGPGNNCPDDYVCSGDDGRCHLVENGAVQACEAPLPPPVDALPPAPDAAPPPVDAVVIDAGIDAPPIDAPPIDAPVIDAPAIDALAIDAPGVDAH